MLNDPTLLHHVQHWLAKHHKTQRWLAAQMDGTPALLNSIFNQQRKLQVKHVSAMVAAMQVSVDELIGGDASDEGEPVAVLCGEITTASFQHKLDQVLWDVQRYVGLAQFTQVESDDRK